LLTLKPPIEATNRENLLRTIVTKPLAPISWRNKAVPEELARIVHRTTQKDPDQRYATAGQLANDLDRFLAAKPVEAPPYHFLLDEREITAARPGGVVLAAFIFFVVGLVISLFIEAASLMTGLMMMDFFGLTMFAIQSVFAAAILACGLAVGYGLLSAHVWARWTGIALAGLLTAMTGMAVVFIIIGVVMVAAADSSAFDFLRGVSPEGEAAVVPKEDGTTHTVQVFDPRNFVCAMAGFYGLPFVVGLVLWITALWNLMSKSTLAWYRFAAEIRAEHRLVRERLAE